MIFFKEYQLKLIQIRTRRIINFEDESTIPVTAFAVYVFGKSANPTAMNKMSTLLLRRYCKLFRK